MAQVKKKVVMQEAEIFDYYRYLRSRIDDVMAELDPSNGRKVNGEAKKREALQRLRADCGEIENYLSPFSKRSGAEKYFDSLHETQEERYNAFKEYKKKAAVRHLRRVRMSTLNDTIEELEEKIEKIESECQSLERKTVELLAMRRNFRSPPVGDRGKSSAPGMDDRATERLDEAKELVDEALNKWVVKYFKVEYTQAANQLIAEIISAMIAHHISSNVKPEKVVRKVITAQAKADTVKKLEDETAQAGADAVEKDDGKHEYRGRHDNELFWRKGESVECFANRIREFVMPYLIAEFDKSAPPLIDQLKC